MTHLLWGFLRMTLARSHNEGASTRSRYIMSHGVLVATLSRSELQIDSFGLARTEQFALSALLQKETSFGVLFPEGSLALSKEL